MDSEASTSNLESAQDDNSESDPHDDEFPVLFYVNDMNSVDAVIRSFECKTNSKFNTISSTKYFGSSWSIYSEDVNHSVMFEDRCGKFESIPYDGVPFFVIGHKTMGCKFGPNHHAKRLEKDREERRRRGAKARKSVKVISTNCPARLRIREIHKFPEFKIECDSRNFRDKASHKLNVALIKREVVGERRFYICLPRWADHKGHKLTQNVIWRTDSLVLKKIHEFMEQGIVDSGQLQKVTYDFVRSELFKGTEVPPQTDSHFFPSKKRIVSLCCTWKKRKKEKEERMARNDREILPLQDDSTDEGGKETAVASGDDDRLSSSHENKSIRSASAMREFNFHLQDCNDHMDHIKNLLILLGDRNVAFNVKKRLAKIVEDLENAAKLEKQS